MTAVERFRIEFVENIPEAMVDGVLYVSMVYATAIHLCACGCRAQIVTPFRRDRWRLVFDGTATILPSIGNWGLPCRSHYFIVRDRVRWARNLTDVEVRASRWLHAHGRGIDALDRLDRGAALPTPEQSPPPPRHSHFAGATDSDLESSRRPLETTIGGEEDLVVRASAPRPLR
jgi:hypothetical protein